MHLIMIFFLQSFHIMEKIGKQEMVDMSSHRIVGSMYSISTINREI